MGALSEKEQLILGCLMSYPSVKDASFHLRNDEKYAKVREIYHAKSRRKGSDPFSTAALYQLLYRLRGRQKAARILINTLLPYRNKNAFLNRLLTPKEKMKVESTEDGFNVEMPKDTVLWEEKNEGNQP